MVVCSRQRAANSRQNSSKMKRATRTLRDLASFTVLRGPVFGASAQITSAKLFMARKRQSPDITSQTTDREGDELFKAVRIVWVFEREATDEFKRKRESSQVMRFEFSLVVTVKSIQSEYKNPFIVLLLLITINNNNYNYLILH